MATALKRLELRLRRAFLAASHRPFSGQVATKAEDLLQLGPVPRILLIRLERIGDVLVSTPVIRALRARYPAGTIDLLLSRANYPVRDAVAPFVTRVWCYEKTIRSAVVLMHALRPRRYDVIVDLVDNPSTTAQLVVRWCRPAAVVGLLHPESGLYTHAAPLLDRSSVHPVERLAQLLLPFGIDPGTQTLDISYPLDPADLEQARHTLGSSGHPLRLGVNISGRGAGKNWGSANYIAAIERLQQTEPRFAVSVCGAPQDANQVNHVAESTGTQAVPTTKSLREFAAVVRIFDLFLTPDTAALHLAAAGKVPTVGLYHENPAVAPWLPYNTPNRLVSDPQGIPAIPVDRVIAALEDLIRERFGSPAQSGRSDTAPHVQPA
jgi:ADP-heptose:LPS heptosyltransferase